MDLKPIQTVYNSYRFRSRLEARWAVFLDALGIAYDYEREGFDLDGVWYLPDFLLLEPRPRIWIEIKPEPPATDAEREALFARSFELCRRSKQHVVTVFGKPFPGEYSLVFVAYDEKTDQLIIPLPGKYPTHRILFAESDCGAVHVVHFDTEAGETLATIQLRGPVGECVDHDACQMHMSEGREGWEHTSPDLWNAFRRARQARFEHGERG